MASRGAAAAAAWLFRGDDATAAATWLFRGGQVAATAAAGIVRGDDDAAGRRRGYSAEAGARRYFAEPVVYLPHCYQANDYAPRWPALTEDDVVPPAGPARFCNANQIDKFEPLSWGLWMNVAARVFFFMLRQDGAVMPTPQKSVETVLASPRPVSTRLVVEKNDRPPGHDARELSRHGPRLFAEFGRGLGGRAQVLRRNPGATLALLRPRDPLGAHVQRHLIEEAAARGVHPSRIGWMPRMSKQAHARRLARDCDLFLDHLVYGAHTTGADALWAAVPLLTTRGFGGGERDLAGRFGSRVGASLLEALDLAALAVDSVRDFERVAADASTPIEALRRKTLANTAREPLFDAARTVRSVETALQAIHEATAAGGRGYHVVADPGSKRRRVDQTNKNCWLKGAAAALGGDDDFCFDDPDLVESPDDAPTEDEFKRGYAARAVLAYPGDANALAYRGLAEHMAGDNAKAEPFLRKACGAAPWAHHFWSNLGHVR